MRRLLFLVLAGVAVGFSLVGAQGPIATDTRDLPIRRVVLYKSGIGFFEHVGRVTGNQRISVPFTSTQLDDVLKTLTVLDLDGGAVSSVGYNTDAPLDRRLDAIGLPIADDSSFPDLLRSLRGARVEVSRAANAVSGRLLTVDTRSENRDGRSTDVNYVSVLSDAGTVHSFELGPTTTVHFADSSLSRRVDQYLANVAAAFDRQRRALNIVATGTGSRRVYVSYISEAPVWKATYRVVMPDEGGGKPMLQGWAIVDNTGGADWSDVELSLVAGAPQSFRQAISQPMYLRRPEVPLSQALLPTPQADSGAIDNLRARGRNVVVDSSDAPLPGVTVQLMDEAGHAASVVTDANGQFDLRGLTGRINGTFSLGGFTTQHAMFEADSGVRAVMPAGSVSETVTVTAQAERRARGGKRGVAYGVEGGVAGGVAGGMAGRLPDAEYQALLAAPMAQASSRDLGELFEYKLKNLVTIPRNESAMVPIVSTPITVERVSLWSAGDGLPRPRRALWLTNTTGLTLDGGSLAVLDHGTFAGEGVTETIKSGDRRLVSFALDLAMQVQSEALKTPQPVVQLRIAHGLMTAETLQCSQTKYTARNNDGASRQLVVEHPKAEGWKLVDGQPGAAETTASAWRFLMPVDAKSTATLTVSAYRSTSTTTMLSSMGDEQLELYVKNTRLDEATRKALEGVQQQRARVSALQGSIDQRAAEADGIADDQERLRDNMKALKGSAEEKQLLQRYVKQLNDQEDRLKAIGQERTDLERQRNEAQAALTQQIEALTMAPPAAAASCR